MAKSTNKKIVDHTNTPLQLESVVIAHEQELQKLAEGNVSLIAKNTELLKKIETLDENNKRLIKEKTNLKASLYTISMRLHEWVWCVPQLKKNINEIIKHAID